MSRNIKNIFVILIMINKAIIITLIMILSFNAYSLSIPKNNKVEFDIIRKNKKIGTHEITFTPKSIEGVELSSFM